MGIHDDCRYWGLTPLQCADHHVRLAKYYARRARRAADKAGRAADMAQRGAIVTTGAGAVAILLLVGRLID